MIYDRLANIWKYKGLDRNLDKAVDYLLGTDLTTLPPGRTEIDGDQVYLQVMEAETHQLTAESYELHRDYFDIQIDIEGCEVIKTALDGVDLIGDCTSDFQKAAAVNGPGCSCVMGPGRFLICMTGEAHAPGGFFGKAERVKKCVVKVARS